MDILFVLYTSYIHCTIAGHSKCHAHSTLSNPRQISALAQPPVEGCFQASSFDALFATSGRHALQIDIRNISKLIIGQQHIQNNKQIFVR